MAITAAATILDTPGKWWSLFELPICFQMAPADQGSQHAGGCYTGALLAAVASSCALGGVLLVLVVQWAMTLVRGRASSRTQKLLPRQEDGGHFRTSIMPIHARESTLGSYPNTLPRPGRQQKSLKMVREDNGQHKMALRSYPWGYQGAVDENRPDQDEFMGTYGPISALSPSMEYVATPPHRRAGHRKSGEYLRPSGAATSPTRLQAYSSHRNHSEMATGPAPSTSRLFTFGTAAKETRSSQDARFSPKPLPGQYGEQQEPSEGEAPTPEVRRVGTLLGPLSRRTRSLGSKYEVERARPSSEDLAAGHSSGVERTFDTAAASSNPQGATSAE